MTTDLTCREFVELVTDYFEQALGPGERIRAEQHLVVCTGCAHYLEQMRTSIGLAATLADDQLGRAGCERLLAALDDWGLGRK
jgi:putative zinc finger protein